MKAMTKMQQLADLENSLQNVLSPVRPNNIFVEELRERLANDPRIPLEEHRLTYAYLTITFGLFIGVFIFWLLRRILRSKKFREHGAQVSECSA